MMTTITPANGHASSVFDGLDTGEKGSQKKTTLVAASEKQEQYFNNTHARADDEWWARFALFFADLRRGAASALVCECVLARQRARWINIFRLFLCAFKKDHL